MPSTSDAGSKLSSVVLPFGSVHDPPVFGAPFNSLNKPIAAALAQSVTAPSAPASGGCTTVISTQAVSFTQGGGTASKYMNPPLAFADGSNVALAGRSFASYHEPPTSGVPPKSPKRSI